MESRAHAIIAVSFLVVFTCGAVAIFLWLNRGLPESRVYDIVSDYSIGGLHKQAEVDYKGVQVGSVKSIQFDPKDPEKIIVRIGVFPNAYITQATYAQLSYQGITGLTYISLSNSDNLPHTPLPTQNTNPARIPMKQGLIQFITESGKIDMTRINQVLANIDKLLNEKNRQSISQMITKLNEASGHLLALERALSPSLKELPTLAQESDKLLQEGRKLVQHANELTLAAKGPAKDIGSAADSVKALSDSANHMVSQLSEDTIPRLEAVTTRIETMARDIDRLSRELKQAPQSLIYGTRPPPPGPGEPGFQAPSGGQGQ